MPRDAWFETVAVAERRARRRLPAPVYGALLAGSEKGTTYRDNVEAFSELGLAPHVAGLAAARDVSTTVLGRDIALPVIISPTGVQAVHPDGEIAVARAAQARGTAMSLSSFASKPVEEVAAVCDNLNYQVYWQAGRDRIAARLDRARAVGVNAIIVTLDWSFSNGRDWGSPQIPDRLDLKAMARLAPSVVTKPAWLLEYLRRGELPGLSVPNLTIGDEPAPTFFGAYGEWMTTPPPTWDDLAWLREQWDGPVMLKGITRLDDAKRAVQAGMSAISVSNHGGNNLDSTPASIRLLPDIAAAVGHEVEVLLDGGVRRGSDVAKALALGAKAVMIGRAYLWGLAANGQAGVENVLDVLRGGLDSALLGLGHDSVHELSPADLWIPPGFTRSLGTE
ncbi:MAG: mycofactocin biosynthesis FMN-dependent deaminase MftD [Microbacterium sp.]